MIPNGIEAPVSVPQDTTTPIEIKATDSKRLVITNLRTGDCVTVDVEGDGIARFELFPSAVANDTILVEDPDDFMRATGIAITPSSAP